MFVAIFGTGTIFDEVLSPHYKGSILPFLLRGGGSLYTSNAISRS